MDGGKGMGEIVGGIVGTLDREKGDTMCACSLLLIG